MEIELDRGAGGPSMSKAIEIGEDGMADAEAALEAMQNFRLAEAALQRNDVAEAERLAHDAVLADPGQSDYLTLLAWIRAIAGGPAVVEEAISTMTRVLSGEPANERALLYRGKLFVRLQRFDQARADLGELLSINPHNREAASELRGLKQRS